jgi:hypothetical protein
MQRIQPFHYVIAAALKRRPLPPPYPAPVTEIVGDGGYDYTYRNNNPGCPGRDSENMPELSRRSGAEAPLLR